MLSIRLSRNAGSIHRKMMQSSFSSTASNATDVSNNEFYRMGLTGGSGLLGTAVLDELSKHPFVNGKPVQVVQFVRSSPETTKKEYIFPLEQVIWKPKKDEDNILDDSSKEAVTSLDGMIHLAGENIGTSSFLPSPLNKLGIHAWTDSKKQEILSSRLAPTRALASHMSPHSTFVSASGISIYGHDFVSSDAPTANESTPPSTANDFLIDVSKQWEQATSTAKGRIVNLRIAPVLSQYGGALEKLIPIFQLGGGGRVGSGQQWFSYISARDAARAILFLLQHNTTIEGPVNVCAPEACTNQEFTTALGKELSRPTLIPLPEFAVHLLFGQMGQEILLGGIKASPQVLLNAGFQFQHPTIDQAIHSALHESI